MNDQKQMALAYARKMIKNQERNIQVLASLPDGLPVEGYSLTDYSIGLLIPHNLERWDVVRKMLEADGWTYTTSKTNEQGESFFYLDKDGSKLWVWLDPNITGSTCSLVQVGTREVPIFEVSCEA